MPLWLPRSLAKLSELPILVGLSPSLPGHSEQTQFCFQGPQTGAGRESKFAELLWSRSQFLVEMAVGPSRLQSLASGCVPRMTGAVSTRFLVATSTLSQTRWRAAWQRLPLPSSDSTLPEAIKQKFKLPLSIIRGTSGQARCHREGKTKMNLAIRKKPPSQDS